MPTPRHLYRKTTGDSDLRLRPGLRVYSGPQEGAHTSVTGLRLPMAISPSPPKQRSSSLRARLNSELGPEALPVLGTIRAPRRGVGSGGGWDEKRLVQKDQDTGIQRNPHHKLEFTVETPLAGSRCITGTGWRGWSLPTGRRERRETGHQETRDSGKDKNRAKRVMVRVRYL